MVHRSGHGVRPPGKSSARSRGSASGRSSENRLHACGESLRPTPLFAGNLQNRVAYDANVIAHIGILNAEGVLTKRAWNIQMVSRDIQQRQPRSVREVREVGLSSAFGKREKKRFAQSLKAGAYVSAAASDRDLFARTMRQGAMRFRSATGNRRRLKSFRSFRSEKVPSTNDG